MYYVYLGDVLCPVAPGKITIDYGSGCETVDLARGGKIGLPRNNDLRKIELSLLLPNYKYPFAVYKSGFHNADFYVEKFQKLMHDKIPFQFIVARWGPSRIHGRGTNITCLMESLRVDEDARNGCDYTASITLREYRDFAAEKLDLDSANSIFKKQRPAENSPAPKNNSTVYRVVKGDCMWMIAQRFYGNGNLYDKIYEANKSKLSGRSPKYLIFVGDELEIPPL